MKEAEPAGGCGGSAGITLFVCGFTARVIGIGAHRFVFGLSSKSASSY
jgi:hypothetical protein